jgi:homeobox protein cut-like
MDHQESSLTATAIKDKHTERRNEDIINVLDYWKQFDIEEKKILLDKQVVEIRDTKSKSIAGRKHLNDVTKSFRAKTREEQVGVVQDVLKSYQSEIDQLSRRAKSSEAAFLGQ